MKEVIEQVIALVQGDLDDWVSGQKDESIKTQNDIRISVASNPKYVRKLCANKWYGHYKHVVDHTTGTNKPYWKTSSDDYIFDKDGSLIYNNSPTPSVTLYGPWCIRFRWLFAYYENSDIGFIDWPIRFIELGGNRFLIFFSTESSTLGTFWIYADVPV